MFSIIKKYFKFFLLKKKFPTSKIKFNSEIDMQSTLGENSVVFSNVFLQNTYVGDYTYIQQNSVIIAADIGRFCSIAADVHIGLAVHPTNLVTTSPVFYNYQKGLLPKYFTKNVFEQDKTFPKTIIGADVWIGQGVLIKSGVTIGVGAVIGAGSVVTKDIEPYSIVGGVPAKVIKKRFSEEIILQLLESEWWQLSESDFIELAPYFNNPISFLENLNVKRKKSD